MDRGDDQPVVVDLQLVGDLLDVLAVGARDDDLVVDAVGAGLAVLLRALGGPGGVGDAVGLTRKLDGRRVGKELTLARNTGFDDAREKHAHVAEDRETQADNQNNRGAAVSFARTQAAVTRSPENEPADQGQHHDAEQDSHQPNIESHIAIENVAELVRYNALQFISIE